MHSGYVEAITDLIKKLHNKGVDLKTLPTAIYARKSTKDESQISLDSQIDTCQRCLEGEKRLKVVNIYREDKISGYHSENRKEFQKLLEELRKGQTEELMKLRGKLVSLWCDTKKNLGKNLVALMQEGKDNGWVNIDQEKIDNSKWNKSL